MHATHPQNRTISTPPRPGFFIPPKKFYSPSERQPERFILAGSSGRTFSGNILEHFYSLPGNQLFIFCSPAEFSKKWQPSGNTLGTFCSQPHKKELWGPQILNHQGTQPGSAVVMSFIQGDNPFLWSLRSGALFLCYFLLEKQQAQRLIEATEKT